MHLAQIYPVGIESIQGAVVLATEDAAEQNHEVCIIGTAARVRYLKNLIPLLLMLNACKTHV